MNKWKEASSLIISATCKSQIAQKPPVSKFTELEKCNFQILALKKGENAGSGRPQVCVFPGGTVSLADSVKEWEGLFSRFGLNLNVLSNSLFCRSMLKLPIFNSKPRNESIPRWLSLRITAIRETFEECGILLCKNNSSNVWPKHDSLVCTTNHFEIDQIELWREKVLDDPFQFISLCTHYNCYPDVESLFLWSNWLSPSHLTDRFDAAFFLTNVDGLVLYRGTPDYKEIVSTEWLKPEELLALSDTGEIWLKPPQWYEIQTLLNIKEFSRLQDFGFQRSIECCRWMPVRVLTLDGEVSLLPGDEMYPDEVDFFKPLPIFRTKVTMESLRCDQMHRMEHSGVKTALVDTRSY